MMKPPRAAVLLIAAASLAGAMRAAAAAEPTAAEADALCARYADAEPPQADRPTLAQNDRLVGCDSEALLYGIGRPADPVQARLCAFGEEDRAHGLPDLFKGESILMTIYANGMGVPRNLPVAVKLACGLDGAAMERIYRVPHLAGTSRQPFYKQVFSPCDDATSGFASGQCAAHDARIHDSALRVAVDAYASSLPAAARPAFAALRRAQARWAEERSGGEIDQAGTLRAAYVIAERQLQNDDFAAMLDRLAHGTPPRLGQAQRAAADRRIEAALSTLLARPAPRIGGEIGADGIRAAQAAWIAYRDSWGGFAAIAYPGWGAAGAEAWVSLKRADMLERLAQAPR